MSFISILASEVPLYSPEGVYLCIVFSLLQDEAVKVNRKLYEHILAANYRQLKDMEAELFTEAELLQRASESAGAA